MSSYPINPVTIRVTATQSSQSGALVQTYPEKSGKVYSVPLYDMTVSGALAPSDSKTFQVIRFGVALGKIDMPDGTEQAIERPTVVGITRAGTYILKWYKATIGWVWRIKDAYYIHKGAPDPSTQAWGALGCIEVTGEGKWEEFLVTVIKLSYGPRVTSTEIDPQCVSALSRISRDFDVMNLCVPRFNGYVMCNEIGKAGKLVAQFDAAGLPPLIAVR